MGRNGGFGLLNGLGALWGFSAQGLYFLACLALRFSQVHTSQNPVQRFVDEALRAIPPWRFDPYAKRNNKNSPTLNPKP